MKMKRSVKSLLPPFERNITRKKDAAVDEYQTQIYEKQKVVLQNEIDQLDIAETEKQLRREGWRTMTDEEMEADQERKLQSIGGYEAERLRTERDAAEQEYQNLLERGQLSTQTEEEWIQEQNNAKQNWLDKQVAINEAYVKNEQAKAQAARAVSNSLISLLEAVGEEGSAAPRKWLKLSLWLR